MQNFLHYDFPSQNKNLDIHLDPFSCKLTYQSSQDVIWKFESVGFRSADGNWQIIDHVQFQFANHKTIVLDLSVNHQIVYQLSMLFQEKTFDIQLETRQVDVEWVSVVFSASQDEHFIGFGERFDCIDQRGEELTLWVEDGATRDLTYIPVPFYMSSKGYGLWLDTTAKVIARMATDDDPTMVSLRIASRDVSIRVLLGDSFKEILSQYTMIAGRPAVPPEWVFGPWKSRDWQTANQHGILEDIDQQIELELPSTVKLIDARWEVAYHSFRFDPKKFPDPKAMIDVIHANGNKLMLWITPWMAVNNFTDPNDYYEECATKGYFLKRPDGEIYISQMGMNPMLVGSCIDFTNPAAVAWYQEQLRYLMYLGVDAFQTDFGEQVPEDAVFYDGRTGKEMHNLYPVLYNEITYQTMQTIKPGALLIRSGWHGSQKHSVIWAGDQTSDFCLNSGMHSAMIAGQTAGLSGFPFWASDIGGYFGNPTDEVHMRWTQFGAFSPVMMLHGAGKREPWYFSDESLQNYRKFACLHTDLFPYIYTYAHIASKTGIPIMRAMVLAFEKEPGIWQPLCEDQYCFGEELVVAPVHYGFSRVRPVYLPAGFWRDFWTGELYQGGRELLCKTDLDEIPVFARTGAIIPRLDPTPQTIGTIPNRNIRRDDHHMRVEIFSGEDGKFELYDGTHFDWNDAIKQLTIRNSPVERQVAVRLMNGKMGQYFKVSNQDVELPVIHRSLSGEEGYSRALVNQNAVIFQFE